MGVTELELHRLRQQEDKNQRLKKLVAIGQDRLPGRSQLTLSCTLAMDMMRVEVD